jgi:thioester reductase-like protein
MAETISVIYHNGAHAHHVYGYAVLRSVNVLSTIELHKLASLHRSKHFNYISTLGVAYDADERRYSESFPNRMPSDSSPGYCLTKWASEKILADARIRGFTVSIYIDHVK